MAHPLRTIDPEDDTSHTSRHRTTMLPPPPDEADERSGLVRKAQPLDDGLVWLPESLAEAIDVDGYDDDDDRPTIRTGAPDRCE